MAGGGQPPTSLLGAAWKDVGGRDKRGHDTWGISVNLFAAWYKALRRITGHVNPGNSVNNRNIAPNFLVDRIRKVLALS
jgi:hypothetical protein